MLLIIIQTFDQSLTDASFWIGLLSVVLFAKNRFAISLPEFNDLSPPISPRSFTTAFRYYIAAFTYVGLFVAAYFTLILVGCVPSLQAILQSWIGSLTIEGKSIGTPAWAALAATTLLPSAPGFAAVDRRIRQTFHDFASIPAKASLIGREILRAISGNQMALIDQNTPANLVAEAIRFRRGVFQRLQELTDGLRNVEGPPKVKRNYQAFFSLTQKVWEGFNSDFTLDTSHVKTDKGTRHVATTMFAGNKKVSKLVACAMLNSEPSEAAIAERLRRLGIPINPISFNFTAQHLILMFVTIAVMTVVGCYLGLIAFAFRQGDPLATWETYKFLFLSWPQVTWPLATVIVYLLPIVLSAGTVMYMLDKQAWDEEQDFTCLFASAVLVFLGSAGLAFLAMLGYQVAMMAIMSADAAASLNIAFLLPWTLPPATVATLFLLMLTRKWDVGHAPGLVVDAAVHGIGAAAASQCAFLLGRLAGDPFAVVPDGMMPLLAPISAGVIGASIGGVLCANTRQRVAKIKAAQISRQTPPAMALTSQPAT